MPNKNRERIEEARRIFFERGELPVELIDPSILNSWIRCAAAGLNSHVAPDIHPLTQGEQRAMRERHGDFSFIARPEIEALYNEARHFSGLIVLADPGGNILEAVGNTGFIREAEKIALMSGVQWAEEAAGTNAIGTALACRRAITVAGNEHFHAVHGHLDCAARPIFDAQGHILGVLDITAPAGESASLMSALVRLSVDLVEHRIFKDGFKNCQTVRFHTDPAQLGAPREAILVIKDGKIMGANRWALAMCGHTWDSIRQADFGDLFEQDFDSLPLVSKLRGADGRNYCVRLESDIPNASGTVLPGLTSLEDIQLAAMRTALAANDGDISAAAKSLNVHRSTFYRRLKELKGQFRET